MTTFGTAPLCTVADIVRGVTYDKPSASLMPEAGKIPLLRATNIGRTLTFDDLVYVPEAIVKNEQRLRLNDIVVATSSGSLSVVGKAAPLLHEWNGTFGAFCCVIRPKGALIHPRYLAQYLRTTLYRQTVSGLAAGVNINNLKREHLEALNVPLTSEAEQQRIFGALESYHSRLDEVATLLDRTERNLKRYRASVLKAAVEGRLVPTEAELARAEKRTYEPASTLLQRILSERRQRWENEGRRGKYVEPEPPDTNNLPDLPEGWCWARLDHLLLNIEAGKNFQCIERPPEENEIGVVKVSAVTWGTFDENESKTCPGSEFINEEYFIRPGDLLISRANTGGDRRRSTIASGRT